jgi:hypothetical protein
MLPMFTVLADIEQLSNWGTSTARNILVAVFGVMLVFLAIKLVAGQHSMGAVFRTVILVVLVAALLIGGLAVVLGEKLGKDVEDHSGSLPPAGYVIGESG